MRKCEKCGKTIPEGEFLMDITQAETGQNIKICIRHDGGNLNDRIVGSIQTRHFEIYPD